MRKIIVIAGLAAALGPTASAHVAGEVFSRELIEIAAETSAADGTINVDLTVIRLTGPLHPQSLSVEGRIEYTTPDSSTCATVTGSPDPGALITTIGGEPFFRELFTADVTIADCDGTWSAEREVGFELGGTLQDSGAEAGWKHPFTSPDVHAYAGLTADVDGPLTIESPQFEGLAATFQVVDAQFSIGPFAAIFAE